MTGNIIIIIIDAMYEMILQEAVWFLSNITAGNQKQVQVFFCIVRVLYECIVFCVKKKRT